jgi:hypothetical protein
MSEEDESQRLLRVSSTQTLLALRAAPLQLARFACAQSNVMQWRLFFF